MFVDKLLSSQFELPFGPFPSVKSRVEWSEMSSLDEKLVALSRGISEEEQDWEDVLRYNGLLGE
jgi:hypothetical protein